MSYLLLIGLIAGLWWWNGQRARRLRQSDKDAEAGMDEAEARSLLGLAPGADLADVRAAHQRLIARVHPDAGGTAGLSARVNAARDALVRRLEQRDRR